jgi:chromosome partitioning protein
MSIITIATSKGGAGKTTLAQIISGAACERGLSVAAIDADYNHSLSDWVRTFSRYPIDVHHELNESKLVTLAGELEDKHDLVVIDTAGAAMQATVFAIGCADLVLVPVQLSSSDVVEGAKTMQLVASAATMTKREIPARVVLTDYQPYTNIAAHTEAELEAVGLVRLKTKLKRLVGFKEMTFNGEVPLVGAAGEHVHRLMEELVSLGAVPSASMKLAS